MQSDHFWYCYQFDSAVAYFGTIIETKLLERNSDGKPKYTVKQLLSERKHEQNNITQIRGISVE